MIIIIIKSTTIKNPLSSKTTEGKKNRHECHQRGKPEAETGAGGVDNRRQGLGGSWGAEEQSGKEERGWLAWEWWGVMHSREKPAN